MGMNITLEPGARGRNLSKRAALALFLILAAGRAAPAQPTAFTENWAAGASP